jgi:hypothetical protein
MSRKNKINAALIFVISMQIACIFLRFDHWPFTNYPMFPGVMGRDDVLLFQVRALLPDGSEKILPQTGWPAMPNYSDSFIAGNWEGLRLQATSDFESARRSGVLSRTESVRFLKLVRMGGDVEDVTLKNKDPFYFQIDLSSNEIKQIPH